MGEHLTNLTMFQPNPIQLPPEKPMWSIPIPRPIPITPDLPTPEAEAKFHAALLKKLEADNAKLREALRNIIRDRSERDKVLITARAALGEPKPSNPKVGESEWGNL